MGPSAAFDITIFGTPTQYYYPSFFAAGPGTFCGNPDDCFCDDELIFTMNTDGTLSYILDNKGETFFNANAAHQAIVGVLVGEMPVLPLILQQKVLLL